ncbi:tetratricopeptide repeat protein [Rubritalea spongiae]|uniref:Tetratricopeptide repeat protein n=1 Tax=Rubritalea spongiae TaxID=430797 RepID=A0ABW5E4C5_9BACT
MRFAALAISTLIVILPASAQQQAAPDSAPNMAEITTYQQGLQAMADQLPELAVSRFQEAYKISGLEDAQNREILYRLTEAQVRANQPEDALKTLKSKFFDNHPERNFWLAQAYAAQGKYLEAIEYFQALDKASIHHDAATLSLASLQLALGFENEAIDSFLQARTSKDIVTKLKASAILSEIYLRNGKLENAKKMIASIPEGEKSDILKQLLDAKLAYANKEYTDAIAKYSILFENEQNIHPRLYQIALLGLADARHAAGLDQEAIDALITFVDERQDTPILLPIFERLSAWHPSPLSDNSPFYLQLQKWAGRDTQNSAILSPQRDSEFIVPPLPRAATLQSVSDKLRSTALYYYAKHTAALDSPGALTKAQFDFSAFRLANPLHPLFGSSILETAKIELQLKQKLAALQTLRTLATMVKKQQVSLSLEAKSKAGFIAGLLSVEAEDYSDALTAFELATKSNNEKVAKLATINAGLAALRSANLAAFDAQKEKIEDKDIRTQLDLEKALWLAHQKHENAREALYNFLLKNPDHPRAVDARIALASICATQSPLDPVLCTALLDTVKGNSLTEKQFTEFSRTSYQLAELKQDWPTAIQATQSFLDKYSSSDDAAEFRLRQGIALYRNGEHNKARQLLVKIALDQPSSPLVPFCYYYAGTAARLEGTPQALKESIDLFEKVVTTNSSLSTEARIQQARILLDVNRTEEAKISLNEVYDPSSSSSQQREIGVLLATALHTQGSEDSGQYAKAVAVYDQLLKHPSLPLAWSNQIHYMKGQTLESMGEDEAALNSYYIVINRENIDTTEGQQEWKWFYQCAFKAIALLEKNKNYRAAVAVAKKVASYGGPETESYQKRARALEMEHMIWE